MNAVSRDAILAGVRAVAAEHLDWDGELPLDARLVEDLELDSIRLLTLAVEVENRFRVALEPEDEQAIATVGDLVEAIHRRLQEQGPDRRPPARAGEDEGGAPARRTRR